MKDKNIIIAALIVAVGLMVAAFLFQYFSDYKSCMRENLYKGEKRAFIMCKQLKWVIVFGDLWKNF